MISNKEFNMRMKHALVFCAAMFLSTGLQAQLFVGEQETTVNKRAGGMYMPVPQVTSEQSQLVYYYPVGVNAGPLNIYIDKQFHTSLLPGEFTTLCVKEGLHTLGAAVNDSPLYMQKASGGVKAQFKGGKNYFVRAAVRGGIISESVYLREAEDELRTFKKNARFISRAAVVENCRYISERKDVTLVTDRVLFKFGGSDYSQMLPESQEKLKSLIEFIKNSKSDHVIQLIGFTDGIGHINNNIPLSEARAETVRRMMVDAGINNAIISTRGNGVAPGAGGCGKRQEDGCNKMSRRVDIMINNN